MGRKQHLVWQYFKRHKGAKYIYGYCNFCKKKFIANPKRMEQHLIQCSRAPKNVKTVFTDDSTSLNVKTPTDETSQQALMQTTRHQESLVSGQLKHFLDHVDIQENKILQGMLARGIYDSCSPLSIVENKYMLQFWRRIRPSFVPPTRYMVSNTLLEKEYEFVQSKVKEKIRNTDTVVLATDSWTDVNGIPLTNIIVTTPQPVFYASIDSKTNAHTGEFMANVLSEAINEIGVTKVDAVISDNAKNMTKAWKILQNKFPHLVTYGCIAHGLSLLLKDLFTICTLSKTAANVKDIIKFFKNKHIPRQVLKKIQINDINHEVALVTAVDTRWGSTVDSFISLFKNKDFLQKAVTDKLVKPIIDSKLWRYIVDEDLFWPKIEAIIKLTKPVADTIKELEGDYPTLVLVYPNIKKLEQSFSEGADSLQFLPNAEQLKVTKAFKERQEFVFHPVQLAAYFLHPGERGENLDEAEVQEAIDFIVNFAGNRGIDNILNDVIQYKAQQGPWDVKYKNLWAAAKISNSSTWWKAYFEKSRDLAKIANKILNFPATSASCERNWKTYASIKTKKRNRLTIQRANKLVAIKFNLHLLTEDDLNFKEEMMLEVEDQEIINNNDEIEEEEAEEINEISDEESDLIDIMELEDDNGSEDDVPRPPDPNILPLIEEPSTSGTIRTDVEDRIDNYNSHSEDEEENVVNNHTNKTETSETETNKKILYLPGNFFILNKRKF